MASGFPVADPSNRRFQEILRAWGFDDSASSIAMENYADYVNSLYEFPVESVVAQARICCFSRRGDNMLMWSHYADGLRGFCLGFNAGALVSINERDLHLFDVQYQDHPPYIDTAVMAVHHDQASYHEDALGETEDPVWVSAYEGALSGAYKEINEIYRRMLATKHTAWEYEEEVRLIKNANDHTVPGESLDIPADALQLVILGERMNEERKEAIRSIVASEFPHARIQVAKLAPLGFFNIDVVADEVTFPQEQ